MVLTLLDGLRDILNAKSTRQQGVAGGRYPTIETVAPPPLLPPDVQSRFTLGLEGETQAEGRPNWIESRDDRDW